MYGASKAFLTEFATSLSAEIFADGLDTLVVHPSPVDTGFYSGNKHDMSAMKLFQRTATSPDSIASTFFKSAGRSVVCDQGKSHALHVHACVLYYVCRLHGVRVLLYALTSSPPLLLFFIFLLFAPQVISRSLCVCCSN